MARITVEDCIDKVDSPYQLIMVAKERAAQLNKGTEPLLDPDNDKNTVISLREIAKKKIEVKDLESAAIYKLRKHVEQVEDTSEEEETIGDDFENLYKGEVSKSGVPILPSKRARKIPEKNLIFKEEIKEDLNNQNDEKIADTESADESLESLQEDENLESENTELDNNN